MLFWFLANQINDLVLWVFSSKFAIMLPCQFSWLQARQLWSVPAYLSPGTSAKICSRHFMCAVYKAHTRQTAL